MERGQRDFKQNFVKYNNFVRCSVPEVKMYLVFINLLERSRGRSEMDKGELNRRWLHRKWQRRSWKRR